ncbi:uncharacterized protein B0I36DRAFT_122844 [Microdochium trichocladiopsis]|uniref:Uncharacterized protein n=1 Tax=Microdochium trichocladiopsis TaxID=1682393 RepID=A0A9P8Y9J9_9PEZI|nr:uncharacterized protein B0I36DRAFT_122844 [Microdochium trichocladiopsis]KAH7031431.1 hypothetical protein B0I36DRAFT_122844 [Microdochium trichocladiopsis]
MRGAQDVIQVPRAQHVGNLVPLTKIPRNDMSRARRGVFAQASKQASKQESTKASDLRNAEDRGGSKRFRAHRTPRSSETASNSCTISHTRSITSPALTSTKYAHKRSCRGCRETRFPAHSKATCKNPNERSFSSARTTQKRKAVVTTPQDGKVSDHVLEAEVRVTWSSYSDPRQPRSPLPVLRRHSHAGPYSVHALDLILWLWLPQTCQ